MKYIKLSPGYLKVKINTILHDELKRAAAEASSAADEPINPEEYAAEIIESYMASRRLAKCEGAIDELIPLVERVMEGGA